jgi:hypothetical protein
MFGLIAGIVAWPLAIVVFFVVLPILIHIDDEITRQRRERARQRRYVR